jgi:hypothetical protein
MKIGLPQSWFARILLGGWILFLTGTAVLFLLGSLFPGPWIGSSAKAIWILSIFVILATFIYVAARAVEMFSRWFGMAGRKAK